jgi:hypothetical protein
MKTQINKKEKLYQRIEKHGKELNNLFTINEEPVKLCKKLFRLESKAHKLSTQYCNGDIDMGTWEKESESILNKVKEILNPENADVEVFLDGDPRGYALKIRFDDTDVRRHEIHTDMGGYGIISPDFRKVQS